MSTSLPTPHASPSAPTHPHGQSHLWAAQALTADGWVTDVAIALAADGRIARVQPGSAAAPGAIHCSVLLPAPANIHSHAPQRALAGLTERRGPNPRDSFWTWRALMYRFLEHLTPDDVEAIAAQVFMESLCAGYAAIGEFHYLHHQPDGTPYTAIAEMSHRLAAAASTTGIGLTLLPVLYQHGGCDGRPLAAGQLRFRNDMEQFARLHADAARVVNGLGSDSTTGVAPHSLRAVNRDALAAVQSLAPDAPIHLHIAEQIAEVDEVSAAWGQRPVDWLLTHHPVDTRWCLVHATQMTDDETQRLARTGAVAGLCPVTEANLGDGIFEGVTYLQAGGRFGIGSDSNVRITLTEELRLLEYSQRLRERSRAVLASADRSTGRLLYESAATGGAQAAGRNAGVLAPGRLADLIAIDGDSVTLAGLRGDAVLDSYLFAGDDRLVTDVWSAGRHVVREGRHIDAERITAGFRKTITRLRALL